MEEFLPLFNISPLYFLNVIFQKQFVVIIRLHSQTEKE